MNDDRTSDDSGGSIGRCLLKMAPGHTRIYCKVRPILKQTLDESTGKRQFLMVKNQLVKMVLRNCLRRAHSFLGFHIQKNLLRIVYVHTL